ncbi:hypothetical protein OAS39_13825 [Pirellulales bacterium]|nr:hypothetical protein [Pirellulales bacterium]
MNSSFVVENLSRVSWLLDRKMLGSAERVLREVFRNASTPESRTILAYNLGAIYWGEIGDGAEARKLFHAAAEEGARCVTSNSLGNEPLAITSRANAIENAMILALSYEEYAMWADQLRALIPDSAILRGQLPKIREFQNRGTPWSDVMYMLASGYYSRSDAMSDPGLYGAAKSIFHLLMKHRKEVQLKRTDWAAVVLEYGALTQRISTDCLRTLGDAQVDEFDFIMEDAMPFVEEYVASYPDDQSSRIVHDRLKKCLLLYQEMRAN